ncbi:DUF3027 domain-containing protein [Corynebacterium pyruviciproducens]|nr:DUF3027 domain-containing protein [Corynebacterium pyruviciproducens]
MLNNRGVTRRKENLRRATTRGGNSVRNARRAGDTVARGNTQTDNPLVSSIAESIARHAAEDMNEGHVGIHIGAECLDEETAIHRFAADVPGYRGWEWNVVIAVAHGSRYVTVNEVSLMPGRDALRAPRWVPYAERVQPGDLTPGGQLPPEENDPRLTDAGKGLHFTAVQPRRGKSTKSKDITRRGLDESLSRWRGGAYGPTSEFAEKAALTCTTCAFYLPLDPEVSANFGVCANEYSADGHVVHSAFGCGAHSDTPPKETLGQRLASPYDDEKEIRL